ncbi:hypothetical protein [Spirosoma aerolatum]|uniref:hypothetical protein n=1 Tax=Spirosoma aerolatum TaxID=1211326 RepID=UPI001FE6E52D|nr:hypothetical protein [Spirosoma aerolatum]
MALLILFVFRRPHEPFLDASIPRVVTDPQQIATVRTKWIKGKLLQTTFLDRQDRILEDFFYGRFNEKIFNEYVNNRKVATTHYYHDDSSAPGFINLSKRRYEYDRQGRVVCEFRDEYKADGVDDEKLLKSFVYKYRYTNEDTLLIEYPATEQFQSKDINIDRWERNKKGQLTRHFRFYVLRTPNGLVEDTLYDYSQRFSYDKSGRRNLAWYDRMYLGRNYVPTGPDTIRYEYDKHNRLIREIHQFTTDIRNKQEIYSSGLDSSIIVNRKRFFEGDDFFSNNNHIDTVEYRYEVFDLNKHLPLQVSHDVNYWSRRPAKR